MDLMKYLLREWTVKKKVTYKNGVKDGPYETLLREWTVKERGTYKDDFKDGPYETYYENGQLAKQYFIIRMKNVQVGPVETTTRMDSYIAKNLSKMVRKMDLMNFTTRMDSYKKK
jgi:hypothetical protein